MLDGGGSIRGINAGRREMPRSELDGLISRAQELGAKGLVWAFREGDGWRSPTAKFLSEAELADLNQRLGAEEGDLLLLVADERHGHRRRAGADAARPGRALRPDRRGRAPAGLDRRLAADGVERRRSSAGTRCTTRSPRRRASSTPTTPARRGRTPTTWSGTARSWAAARSASTTPRSSRQVFAALGIDAETAEARFGFLLEALRYGAPPHGGIAYGVDRIVQRLCGAETIRDVIAFPKTASGFDLLTGAPAPVDEPQLRDLGIAHPQAQTRRATEMGLRDWLPRRWRPAPGPGQTPVFVDDPSFDSWEVVRDFADVRTARAWHQALIEAGIEAVLTADWPLDRFGHGDIALRVPADRWSEAELHLSNLDD